MTPTWDMVIDHAAGSRRAAVTYIMAWLKRLVKDEPEPVSYIRLYGPQSSGKSTFARAVGLLARSENISMSLNSVFNEQLLTLKVALIEGTDLSKYDRMERLGGWIGKPTIQIGRQYRHSITIENKIRWIECVQETNDRIPPWNFVFLNLARVSDPIPPSLMMQQLNDELTSFRERLVQ